LLFASIGLRQLRDHIPPNVLNRHPTLDRDGIHSRYEISGNVGDDEIVIIIEAKLHGVCPPAA